MSRFRRFLPAISILVLAVCVALAYKQSQHLRAWTVRIEQENDTVDVVDDSDASSESSLFDKAELTEDVQRTFKAPYLPLDVEPVEGQYVRRIVAVGDIHSDYENALKVLQMSHVVDANGNWTGNVDLFVQTGDILDRGDDTIKLYLWLENLRSQARHAGGDMVTHLGNHEWMNLLGDWRYVHDSEIKTFGSPAARQKMLTTGRIGKAWTHNYTVTSRIPLHPSLGTIDMDYDATSPSAQSPIANAVLSFVHGGLSPTFEFLTPYPSRINDIGKQLLQRLQTPPFPLPHPPHPYAGMPSDSTIEEKRLYDADGPVWYRGWAMDPEEVVCNAVDDVLARTGTRRLIMGHTPDFHRIVSRCGGKIIIIDTGFSHSYGGELSALSITYTLTPTNEDKTTWTEREFIVAVYQDRQEVLAVDEREVTGSF